MFLSNGKILFFISSWIVAIMLLTSCTVIENYPKNTPFVYENKIIIKGEVDKDDKKRLEVELPNYWDDSLRAIKNGKIGVSLNYFGYAKVLKNPPVFDTIGVSRSILFMNSFLQSQGYYNASIQPLKFDTAISGDKIKISVVMEINLAKHLVIDSVSYDSLFTTRMRKLAIKNKDKSYLIRGKQYTKALIASELDRLVSLYRANGYYKFTRENIYAEVDTTDASLLEFSFDPFEQARKIATATARRKVKPTINVTFKQKVSADTNAFKVYRVGKTTFFPKANFEKIPDSLMKQSYKYVQHGDEFTLKQNEYFIMMKPLREHSYLRKGTIYNEENYYKTINAYSQLGPWNQVDFRAVEKLDSVNTIDLNYFLTPAKRNSFGYDFEVSRNSGSIIAGNLLGLSNVFTIRDRNVWKRAIQSSTVARAGVELGFSDTVLQTFQASISHTYSFPRVLFPYNLFVKMPKKYNDYKTLVSINGSFTDRRNFFRLRSGTASYGFECSKNKHSFLWQVLNVELYSLDTLPRLLKAFESNPFLRTAFNTGYVVSLSGTYTLTYNDVKNPNVSNKLRISGELTNPLILPFQGLSNKLYQYIKVEAEFKRIWQWRKTSFAIRGFGGMGYNYNSDPVLGQSLPFFKQFVAGGPYSMRAWGVRQIGLGSSLKSDTSSVFRDRYGDVQLEANIEYRFKLFTVGGVNVNSAVFADIGNIWNMKTNLADAESQLRLSRIGRDIAIAAGTGVRLDFNYFLVRFDFAYKVKDPARLSNGGWMSFRDFEWRNKEFDNPGSSFNVTRNNFSFQLGIGLPF